MSGSVHDNLTEYSQKLSNTLALVHDLREVIRNGLNSGRGDGEWEALVVAGDLLGLEYNEEEDRYE